jgi:hypothetical protein
MPSESRWLFLLDIFEKREIISIYGGKQIWTTCLQTAPKRSQFTGNNSAHAILDSPYYVFVALCIVVIVVSLIKIAASNKNIECFREYFAVGYRAPDPSFFLKFLHTGQDKK